MKGISNHKRGTGRGARCLLPAKEKQIKFRYRLHLNDISLVPVNGKRKRNKTSHLTCGQATREETCQPKQPSHTARLVPSYGPSGGRGRKKSVLFFKVVSVVLFSFQKRVEQPHVLLKPSLKAMPV